MPVGIELLPEIVVEEMIVGVTIEVVELVPGSTMIVDELGGSVTLGSVPVELVTGGCSVTVAVSLVETPVPGPVKALDGRAVAVAFGDGSIMLEITELMSLKIELIGLLDSVVLELVTMPVGASRISDELVVVTGGSTDIDALVEVEVGNTSEVVGVTSTELLVVACWSSELLELVPRVDEDSSDLLVEVFSASPLLLVVVVAAVVVVLLLSLDAVSVEVLSAEVSLDEELVEELSTEELLEEVSDEELLEELPEEELLSDELPLEELLPDVPSDVLSDVLSVEVESGVGVGGGGVTTMVLEMMMVVTFGSGSGPDSDSICLLVVSVDELGDPLSCDVIVAFVNWRLTCCGK